MSKSRRNYGKGRKRIVCLMLLFSMVLSLLGSFSWNVKDVYAETINTGTGNNKYDDIMSPELPKNYDANDKTNPYTNDNKKFLFAENNELTIYKSWDVNKHDGNPWISTFDNYKNGSSMKIASSSATTKAGWASVDSITANYAGGASDDGIMPDKSTIQELNYQDCVAFDPSGSGRKDHVAYVGYKNNHNYIWVYDTVNKKSSGLVALPNSYQANNLNYITSRNYFTITAGDYNDDGKDTIVVYNVAEQNGFSLLEYSYDKYSRGFTKLSSSQRMLHAIYRNKSAIYNSTNGKDKLGCNLTTGDFDGDGVDDLGVISYGQEYSSVKSDPDYRLFTPMVAAVFGKDQDNNTNGSKWSVVASGTMQTTYVALNKAVNSNKNIYESMRSPSISGGDIDGDGADELVCSGFYCKVEDSGTSGKYNDTMDYGNITLAAVSAKKDSINIIGQKLGLKDSQGGKNVWTAETTHRKSDYETKVQLATECVAMNGQNAPEKVFVNGSIYDYNGVFTRVYTGDYFRSEDDYVGLSEVDVGAVTDVAVGVFDGNTKGREQVMFITALKEYGNGKDYYMTMGAIGGNSYNETTNEVKSYYTSPMDKDHYSLENNGDSTDEMLNFCLAASDNDNDGLLGSYKDKTCVYNDPKVSAVLQAGPYFENLDELGGYDDPCETTYYISTSYEQGKSTGNSVSFGAGFAGSIEADLGVSFEGSLKLGYSLDWNKTFEESVATTHGQSFVAQGQDHVIISRIPVTVYCYDVYKPTGGVEAEGYTIAVPGKPVYYQLSIDEYNEFVVKYNGKFDNVDSNTIKLKKIYKDDASSDGKRDLPADNEGNPQNYWSSWASAGEGQTSLSQSPMSLGYGSGHSAYEWSTSDSSTVSTEMSHGFSFELEVLVGGGALGNHVRLGGYTSLEYLHSKGSFKTETIEKGVSGQVENINATKLMEKGLTNDNIRAYGFKWEFGTWKRELTTESGEYTPFFGYRVYDVTMPARAPENFKATKNTNDEFHSVDLKWDSVDDERVLGYNVYIKDGSNYNKINTALVTGNSYTATNLESNTNYTFVVTTEAYIETREPRVKKAESQWSEEASISTSRKECTIKLTPDHGAEIAATSGEKQINSGDKIYEGETISIKVTSKTGYNIIKIALKKSDGSESDITSADGTYSFVAKEDVEIIVNSVEKEDRSEIIYNNGSNGRIVSAKSRGIDFNSGAMIIVGYGDVSIEAKADEGFVLKEWQIKTGDSTQSFAANGSNIYTFVPYAEEHEITPIFVSENDPSVIRTINVDSSKGGSITITDNDGKVYEPSEGKVKVNVGTPVKISAVPDNNYVFKSWTGDLSINTTKEISYTIYEDMAIGARFYAPVKYKVSYNVNNELYGKIIPNIWNNTSCVKGDVLEFKATPSEGYRLEYWKIKKGNEESKIETDDVKSEYQLKLNVENTTIVTAYFKKLEEHTLTLSDSDYGNTKVTNQNGQELKNGDTYFYGDELTLTAEPEQYCELTTFKMNDEEISSGYKIVAHENITAQAQYVRYLSENGKSCPDVSVEVSPTSAEYTGKEIIPEVMVTVGDKTLTLDDYTVSYRDNVYPGTATVNITGKGIYKGTVATAFTIMSDKNNESTSGGSGTSGGSSGSGGSSPSETSKPTEEVSIPVENENTVEIKAEIKDGTANVSEITSETIDKISNNADSKEENKADTVKIDLSGVKQEVTAVTLSKTTVETLAAATAKEDNGIDTATIELSNASVVLDSKTLETVAKEAKGNDIKLVINEKEQSKLNASQQNAIKDHHVATLFEALLESNGKAIHDFNGGTATVAIDFTPEEGKNMDYYHMVHISDNGVLTRYKTRYTKGKLIFTAPHFSDYAVIYDESEKNQTAIERTAPVTGLDAKVDKTTLTKKGAAATIIAIVKPDDAANKNVTYTSSNTKVATVDKTGKVTAVANGKTTVTVKTEDGLFTKKIVITVKIPDPTPTEAQIAANSVALNSNAAAKWTKENYLMLTWGKVKGAEGYEVYVRKCDGKSLWTKPTYTAKSEKASYVTLKKLGGKKFSTTANYKYGVRAYKYVNGKKVYIGRSLTYHFVGSNNKKETNAKSVTAGKKSITLGVKKTTKLTCKVTKVNAKRALEKHDTLVRYISSNPSVAKVDLRTGKVTGVKAGKCKIYCIAVNGVKTTVSVTVK
ncbi:MAG: Ig-like domain-containing protein [Lachnospiraceae bacterium]|nr:Ig-like domain-containing protein [Lachnospiraceae bacterium]